MSRASKENQIFFLMFVGLMAWVVPGAGHFLLNEKKRGIVIFITIALTFGLGLYVGSIGVINPVGAWWWYLAQIVNSPFVVFIGRLTADGGYPVYGRPNDIGQIYTSIAGLLNLLCIINAVYLANLRKTKTAGD